MKLFGRRKVAGLAASAPLAVGMMTQPAPSSDFGALDVQRAAKVPFDFARIPEPPTLKQYYDSMEKGRKAWEFFDQRRDLQRYRDRSISPNIACLKSVSTQHKYIMHMREVDRIHEENRSFAEKMMDLFGVRDYFKKMEERNGGVECAPSNRY